MNQASEYIIVGADSAGCALAARLSEHHLVAVTLIDAYFTPCRPGISRDAGPAFHLMPGQYFIAGPGV